ncbi:MAG: TolC family protein [Candidatus Solibacter usitatus]|nr:TolC family protein [Candidatus Solibacter usitatus]
MSRPVTALTLCLLLPASLVQAQQTVLEPVRPSGSILTRPYRPVEVSPIRLAGSTRLAGLMRAGNLYLTAQDAIALALENNIDLEISRYNPILAAWRLQRSQAGSVAAGQGVTGSQQAAGVGVGGAGAGGGGAANASISQIGPVTQTLDPIVQQTSAFTHSNKPQSNVTQSRTAVLTSDTRVFSASIQQGLISGGSVTLASKSNYLWENSPTNILNPSVAPSLSLTFQHSLLRGFGIAVNSRTITISRMNLNTTDLNFRSQVSTLITQVLNLYYGLAASHEDVKARQLAAGFASTLRDNVRRQVELGSLAPPDLTRAESQVATTQLALVSARTTLQQQELRLKSLLSRNGLADPVLTAARIVPMDRIAIPAQDDLPPIEEMIRQAQANRPDLLASLANLEASKVSSLGTRNGVLPNLVAFGAESHAGLAGDPHGEKGPDPYFIGGFGTAMGQVMRRNFATSRIGAFYQAPIHNRQAQADAAIDQLQFRQSELSSRKSFNRVEVDILNAIVALKQARARHEAALRNQALQQELLQGEQRKFELGASTPTNVIQQQRDLATAQSAAVAALASYSNARVSLDQTLGRTLEANGISIAEARDARVNRRSAPPPP